MTENQEENHGELIYRLSLFEQQIRQMQAQVQAVEQGILELSSLKINLDELKNSKDKEILASVGRGIFIKSKVLSDNFIVDVGNKILVKKTIPETQNIIGEQIKKLDGAKKELEDNIEILSNEIRKIIEDAEKRQN
ncbi:MAG: prefoldin subunit alpha [Nanoarchaeota archaeon]